MRHTTRTALSCAAAALASLSAQAAPSFDIRGLAPFWRSRTMYGESVLFVREAKDAPPSARLLFKPTRVLSVRSTSGLVTYVEGKDYRWQPGKAEITIPDGSAIPVKLPSDLLRKPGTQQFALTHRNGQGEILFGGGHEYLDMQTVVTYEHAANQWKGPRPAFAGAALPRTVARMQGRGSLVVALLGDSISTGCNASGWCNVPPYQPAWQDLVVMNLESAYGCRVDLRNFAVGGTETGWGLTQIDRVAQVKPQLVVLAFGMNDSAGRSAPEYTANIKAMMAAVRKTNPECEFILVAPMRGNADWTALRQELFGQYRDGLASLCGKGAALADVTGVWDAMLATKLHRDLTGNGVNHPNDFSHRVYAQVLSALLIADPLRVRQPATLYRNPFIDARYAADPTVLRVGDTYYLYPTLDGQGYDVWTSRNLVDWERKPKCYTDARGGVWAPDVYHHSGKGRDGRFYLYYTADNPGGGKLIGVAVADSPLGPFVDKGVLVQGAIDAHLFRDDDGSLYLYYVMLPGGFRIMVQAMASPLEPKGEPRLCIRPTEPWEKSHGEVTEGPWMVKHNGTCYLMYSGSGADGPGYGVGYATAQSPMGPFTKYTGNPIAQRGGAVYGPGHHCTAEAPDGSLWMIYHQKNTDKVDWDRFLAMDPLWFDEEGVMHTRVTRDTWQAGPGPKARR